LFFLIKLIIKLLNEAIKRRFYPCTYNAGLSFALFFFLQSKVKLILSALHAALHGCLARQACPAVLPGSLAIAYATQCGK
jgi:hypothetical protein